jgi:hypothetical protein
MREFGIGIVVLIASIIVSAIVLPLGFVYGIGHSIFFSFKKRDPRIFFIQMWVTIDGFFAGLGHVLYHVGLGQDIQWNVVSGELLEDMITPKEDTTFRDKTYPVSASVGKLEIDQDLNKYGRFSSRVLNIVFMQKQHARDAWNWNVARNELKKKYFEKK